MTTTTAGLIGILVGLLLAAAILGVAIYWERRKLQAFDEGPEGWKGTLQYIEDWRKAVAEMKGDIEEALRRAKERESRQDPFMTEQAAIHKAYEEAPDYYTRGEDPALDAAHDRFQDEVAKQMARTIPFLTSAKSAAAMAPKADPGPMPECVPPPPAELVTAEKLACEVGRKMMDARAMDMLTGDSPAKRKEAIVSDDVAKCRQKAFAVGVEHHPVEMICRFISILRRHGINDDVVTDYTKNLAGEGRTFCNEQAQRLWEQFTAPMLPVPTEDGVTLTKTGGAEG